MSRVFVYDGKRIPDPDPTKTPDEVKGILADFYPELYSAEIKTGKDGEDTVHELVKRVGTKG
ncbi:MAG: PRTRC system protein C [Dehalococcoidia bacterium]|jgi:PRTRC genetic system protein C